MVWHREVQSGALAEELRRGVVTQLRQTLHRDVRLQSVSGDPLHGFALRGLAIAERGGFARGVAFSADEVRLHLRWSALWSLHPDVAALVTQVDLRRPHLSISRDAGGGWSVGDLFARPGGGGAGGGPGFRGRVTVADGAVAFTDALGLPAAFQAAFSHIAGAVSFAPQSGIDIALTGAGEDGANVRLTGRYRTDGATSDLDISAADASAAHWGPYFVRLQTLRWVRGRFGGEIHVALSPQAAPDFRGSLRLYDTDLEYRPAHLALRRVAGPVDVDGLRASTAGLTVAADGSPLRLEGSVIYAGGPWMQIRLTSSALDLARVQSLFFPHARIALTGTAGADMAIAGPVQGLDIDGQMTGARGTLNGQPFERARARVQYGAGSLTLSDLSTSVGGGRLAGVVMLGSAGGTPSYLFSGDTTDVDVGTLAAIGITGIGKVAGRVSGHVVGVGTGTQVDVMGDIRMSRGRFQGLPFSDAHGIFLHRADGSVALDYLGGRLDGASVYSSGEVAAGGALELDVLAHGLSLSEVAAQAGVPGTDRLTVLEGEADITGRAGGDLAAPVLSGDATVTHGRIGPAAFAHGRGRVTVSGRGIDTPGLMLQNGTTMYQVSGGLRFRPLSADGLRLDVDGLPADWVSAALPDVPEMTGSLGAALSIDGPLPLPGIGGRVTLDRGTVARQHIDHAQADLAPEPGRIRITDGEARVNGSRLTASGTVVPSPAGPVDLTLAAQHVRISDLKTALGLRVPVEGSLSVAGRVEGTVAHPIVSGRVSAPDLLAGTVTFQASGAMSYEDSVLTLSPLELFQGGSRYTVSGSIRAGPQPSAALALDVAQGQIATLLAATGLTLPAPLDGRLDGRITLTGPLEDPEAGLSLRLGRATFGAYPMGDGVADVTLSHQAIDIQRFEIHPAQGQVAAKGRIDLRGPSAVELSAEDLNPDFLRPFFQLGQPLQGHLNFTVQFSGPTRDPKAGISLSGTGIGVADVTADRISALAFYTAGQLTLEEASVSKGQHTMLVGGAVRIDPLTLGVDPQAPLSLGLRLQDADLSFLGLLTPKIADASGTVAGQVDIGGTGAAPQMTGFLRSRGGRLHYEALRTPLENLNVDVAFSQNQIDVRDISATLGGGRAAASGTLAVRDFRPSTVAMNLNVDAAKVDAPGLYTGQVDGALRLAGPAYSPALSGRATLSNGVISPLGLEPGAARAGSGGSASPVPDVRYDVDVEAGKNLAFTAGPVRAQVQGAVHVGGTFARPWLSGRVTSPSGEVAFLGASFRLTGGEALFSQTLGVEPQITAHAEQVYGDTIVFLDVSGPATHPSLSVSANPPLAQSDIVTLIARNSGLGSAESILGTGIGQYLFTPVREALRLNEFSVSYSQESPLTLRIGKYLLSNLYLTVSQIWPSSTPLALSATLPFGTFPRQFLAGQSYTVGGLEYFFNQYVLLNFTVDTFGDLGTFVIARFPF